MMVGEAQITGQAKEAHEMAHNMGLLGGILDQTFHEAFHLAKRIRTETELTRRPVSLVTLVERTLHDHIAASSTPVLILGAGEMAAQALRLIRSGDAARRVIVKLAAVLLTIQAVHVLEEWVTGFHERLPALFDLHPWSTELYLGFNISWIGIWLMSLFGVRVGLHAAFFPLWFLGLASMLNGVAHPLLALTSGGYFPGLWTSPLCAVGGLVLLSALARYTGISASAATAARVHS